MNFRSDHVYILFGKSNSGKTHLAGYIANNLPSVAIFETLLKRTTYRNIANLKNTFNVKDISLCDVTNDAKQKPFYPKIRFYPRDLDNETIDSFCTELLKRRDTLGIFEETQMIFPNRKNPSKTQTMLLRAGGHDWAVGQVYMTQRISDCNKLTHAQYNHAFFFKCTLSNDLDYIEENWGSTVRNEIPKLRHQINNNPQDHEFVYCNDQDYAAVCYLDGNQIKTVRMLSQ